MIIPPCDLRQKCCRLLQAYDRRLSRLFMMLACTTSLLTMGSRSLQAEDRVTYIPPGASSPVVALGEVIEYTGRELILLTTTGQQHLASDSVSSIETGYTAPHLEGITLFRLGKTSEAQQQFQKGMEVERREWVQREIRSWLMRCALRRGDMAGAIQEFKEITLTDPQTRFWGIAPLIWSPVSISEALREEARHLLKSGSDSDRLIAASLLLLDPALGEAAEAQLIQLSRNVNPILSTYSKAQLWRLTLAARNVHETTLSNWQRDIQHMKPELRAGPQYLLSRGQEIRGDLRRAAAEALWIPYVYGDAENLGARALFDAADYLSRAGLRDETRKLKSDLMTRYPWSREASLVRAETLQPSQSNSQ